MICKKISNLLGLKCYPLSDDGMIALVDNAFTFQDGDSLPVYVEQIGDAIRYFVDGETILHFMGRGAKSVNGVSKSIRKIVEKNGVTLNHEGIIEILANEQDADVIFNKYLKSLFEIVAWEEDNSVDAPDPQFLVEEVRMYLKTIDPEMTQEPSPEYIGISGHKYTFDFLHGDDAILTIGTHASAVNAAFRKIYDINNNNPISSYVIIDDRENKEEAKSQQILFSTVASKISTVSSLEKRAVSSKFKH